MSIKNYKVKILSLSLVLLSISCFGLAQQSWIRINQVGYQPKSVKVAVLGSKEEIHSSAFEVRDFLTDEVVFQSQQVKSSGSYACFKSTWRLDFSDLEETGNQGANGIPDILDEAKWGLDWLNKMNPGYGIMYNQIADDRDHRKFTLPTLDTVRYGKGLERPVYFVTGKPRGLGNYKNRSTGVSSTAASLTFYLSSLESFGLNAKLDHVTRDRGGISVFAPV